MGWRHLATWKEHIAPIHGGFGLVLEGSRGSVKLPWDLLKHASATAIKAILEHRLGGELSDVFVHVNRDETIAMAVGKEPEIWPEDTP